MQASGVGARAAWGGRGLFEVLELIGKLTTRVFSGRAQYLVIGLGRGRGGAIGSVCGAAVVAGVGVWGEGVLKMGKRGDAVAGFDSMAPNQVDDGNIMPEYL